jgi:hypothetical protein
MIDGTTSLGGLPVPIELPVTYIVSQTIAANVQYREIDDFSELLR